MAKISFNPSKITSMFTSRFELLGLVLAGGFVLVCLVLGLLKYLEASSPIPEIRKDVDRLEAMRNSAALPPKQKAPDAIIEWPEVGPKMARLDLPLVSGGLQGGDPSQRDRPEILTIDVDPQHIQMDYMTRGICTFEIGKESRKLSVFGEGEAAKLRPVALIETKNLVVVNATFPYLEQMERYRKALRFEKLEELITRGFAPTFEGFNVERRKITLVNGQEVFGDWEPLYAYDPNSEILTLASRIKDLLSDSFYDDHQADKYRDVIHGMSVTPLPRLLDNAEYPPINLPGIKDHKPQNQFKEGADKPPPGQVKFEREHFGKKKAYRFPEAVIEDRKWSPVPFDDLQDSLKEQVLGKFNPFSPFGTFTPADLTKSQETSKDFPPNQGEPLTPTESKEASAAANRANNRIRDAMPVNPKGLVRFFDVDVEPGATYQYRVQMRLANPNHGLAPRHLSQPHFAREKELTSKFAETPRITIPASTQHRFYITHQERNFINPFRWVSPNLKGIDMVTSVAIADRQVAFQVHSFVKNFTDKAGQSRQIADWVVAEKLLVARGEMIGRECEVEVRAWNKRRSQWEIEGSKKGSKGAAVLVDFRPDPAAVLLDFVGGRDSATEALILMPDLTMQLSSSRADFAEQNERGQERRRVFDQWKSRLDEVRKTPDKISR